MSHRGWQGRPHHFAASPLCSSPPFQKHYFPIDYAVQVQYEEVLRPANITRLVGRRQGRAPVTGMPRGPTGAAWVSPGAPSCLQRNRTVSEAALRYLWFHISSQAVLRIREVLPEKHPSWKYTQELCQLFDALGTEYSKYRQVGGPRGSPGTPAQPRARTQPRTPLAGVQAPCRLRVRGQARCTDLGGTRALRVPTRCAHGHEPPGVQHRQEQPSLPVGPGGGRTA